MRTLNKCGSVCLGWALLGLLTVLMVGCAGGRSSTFYLLHSMESPPEGLSTTAGEKGLSILVGPITLPGYLDRNQMITIAGKNEMALDEFNRWAESLRDSFYRVLLEDLSLLLKTPNVYAYNQSGSIDTDYEVSINITRFDCAPKGDAVLTAFWTVKDRDGSTPLITKKSVFRAPVSSTGFSGMVEAQNQTLTTFSREIVSAIQSLER